MATVFTMRDVASTYRRSPIFATSLCPIFDKAMHHLEEKYKWLSSPPAYVYLKHETDKMITFRRGGLFWIFNFHSEKSFDSYRVGVPDAGTYSIVLCSDNPDEYGGFGRVKEETQFFSQAVPWDSCQQSIQVYSPCRTVLVLLHNA